MAHAKTLTQAIGFGKPTRPSEHSPAESIQAYIDEVIRLFLSDLAAHIKQLRRTKHSRASKLVVQFFQTLAKSHQPINDLYATGVDTLRDFADFLQSTRESLRADLTSGQLKAHDVLTQSLEPTAQFLSDTLQTFETRKDILKIFSDYLEAFEQAHDDTARLPEELSSSVAAETVSAVAPLPAFSAVPKRARPYFVKETCNPDFGFSFGALFSHSLSLPSEAYRNGKRAARANSTSMPAFTTRSTEETPPAIRQFVKFISDYLDQRAQRESISHIILRTFTRLSNAPDVFSELDKLSFVAGISDFKAFLESQRTASASTLSREIASEVGAYLLGLFNTALSTPATAAQLMDYAESAPVEADEVLSLLDKATPPPEPEPITPPKVSDITDIVHELEPAVPDTLPAEVAEPTEAEYIQYVVDVLTQVKARVSPDAAGYAYLSELIASPDILAALSQTEHEWLKEFANFIGESWLHRTPVAKLRELSADIITSLSSALSTHAQAQPLEPLDAELDELLSMLKPPPLPNEEPLPTLPPEALEELKHDIEEVVAPPGSDTLPVTAQTDSPSDTIAVPSDALDQLATETPEVLDSAASADLLTPSDATFAPHDTPSDLSDALASLADTDDLRFQMDTSSTAKMPDYLAIALETLQHAKATLPRTDAGVFASEFFDNILASDNFLAALQTSTLSPIRDIGNFILSANQSQPEPEAFKTSLMTKFNEAIGLLFSEYERTLSEQTPTEDIDFSLSDFILPDDTIIAATPLADTRSSSDIELFVRTAPTLPEEIHDEPILPSSDLLSEPLPELTDELFNELNALTDAASLELPDTAAPADFSDALTSPPPSEPTLSEPSLSDSFLSDDLLLESDPTLTSPSEPPRQDELALLSDPAQQEQRSPETPQAYVSEQPAENSELSDSLLLQDDLLDSGLLLDESLLNEHTLSEPDTRMQELSSLHDLSVKQTQETELSEHAVGDTLLFLDDSAFLNTDLLLDDTALSEPAATPTASAPASAPPSEPSEPLLELADSDFTLDDSLTAPTDAGATDELLLDTAASVSETTADLAPPAHPTAEQSAPAVKFVPDELQQIFLDEATEYLEKLNEDLLELDKFADTQQPELVNRVLRGSHTIKGSAAMVQLKHISDLAHKMEDSLQVVRDQNLKAPKPLIDVLFKAADAIGEMLKTFRQTGKDEHPKKDELVSLLQNYTEQLEKFGTIREAGIPEPAPKFVPNELEQVFLDEATEYLEKLNEDLLELDKFADTQQPELVNRVLRGSHTIKGSAAMVQLKHISDLAHKMEDSLQVVRDQNLKAPKPLIDVLFKAADAIGEMLKTFRQTGKDEPPNRDVLIEILQNYTTQLQQFGEIRSVISPAELKESKAIEAVETTAQLRRPQSVAEQTVRIDIRALNNLVNLSAELVIARNRLNNELAAFSKVVNRFIKERTQLAQISKKVLTMIQKGSKEASALTSFSDVLKEFSDTEFDRFSELDIISRDIKSAILNLDDSISDLKSVGSMLNQNIVKVSSIANDLNREIVGMRMVPVKQMFTRFSRSVRDIAKMEQKEINLVTEGEDTKLDKTVMEEVIEPIMHIVRNAIGHGIELPEVRRALGKPPVGTITLRAYQKGSRVILEVEDDGSGINIEKVKAKAVQIGLITPEEAEKMTPAQATELIFRPGFSTADKVTELQGRGVGMDVVQNTIRRLKGTTNIETISGKGTKFIISLPLTLAIGDALLVTALDQTYAIPLEPVLETSYISTDLIEQDEDGKRYITLRDERIELRYLNDILGYQSDVMLFKAKVAVVVVKLEDEQKKIAIAVEKLIGKEEIVVKTLGKHLRNVRGVIGSTILGDGQVIIILDIEYLLRSEEARLRDVYVSVNSAAAEAITVSTEAPVQEIKRRKRKGAKITVLHADDSPSVRKYVQSILKNADITVISVDDGLAALNRLPTANVDLVISDLEMPRMNGFELVSEIRKMPEYQDLPIIIVTARAGDKHRRTGLELGANAFLNKPFDPQQLIETIESFVA